MKPSHFPPSPHLPTPPHPQPSHPSNPISGYSGNFHASNPPSSSPPIPTHFPNLTNLSTPTHPATHNPHLTPYTTHPLSGNLIWFPKTCALPTTSFITLSYAPNAPSTSPGLRANSPASTHAPISEEVVPFPVRTEGQYPASPSSATRPFTSDGNLI
ncbi:hypothetical protein GRF29_96g1464470 [Pseudopithomyces chartarum]|uniref:Uncharacterized protein n=1 Tax=Pseudopithomyces chartarum TaxID=1892770 RepID=A0AAN6LZC1_9PLEO|nr:hypothetical protein GRF29_96g1464470 [Pseudopithomyces chartarum]